MKSSNILEEILLNSGTGVIDGFFRMPKDIKLIFYWNYKLYRDWLADKENEGDEEGRLLQLEGLTEPRSDGKNFGGDIAKHELYHQNPLINFSKQDGTFLGSYKIEKFDFFGGEEEGSFSIEVKSESYPHMKICALTEQYFVNSNFGTCTIYMEGDGEELLIFS